VCVYGYRLAPFGERAMISGDGGKVWTYGYVLRDDGPDADLGYPASAELCDGSVTTVYDQKVRSAEEKGQHPLDSIVTARLTLDSVDADMSVASTTISVHLHRSACPVR